MIQSHSFNVLKISLINKSDWYALKKEFFVCESWNLKYFLRAYRNSEATHFLSVLSMFLCVKINLGDCHYVLNCFIV